MHVNLTKFEYLHRINIKPGLHLLYHQPIFKYLKSFEIDVTLPNKREVGKVCQTNMEFTWNVLIKQHYAHRSKIPSKPIGTFDFACVRYIFGLFNRKVEILNLFFSNDKTNLKILLMYSVLFPLKQFYKIIIPTSLKMAFSTIKSIPYPIMVIINKKFSRIRNLYPIMFSGV